MKRYKLIQSIKIVQSAKVITVALIACIFFIMMTIECNSQGMNLVVQSRIDGEFQGWSGNTLFKLTNGTYWLQAQYDYFYHYAYSPIAKIYRYSNRYFLKIEQIDKLIQVVPIQALESQIDGDFEGWSGDTLFKLTNGQVWQQVSYDYWYHYAYMPRVLIYQVGGKCYMQVKSKKIEVIRLK